MLAGSSYSVERSAGSVGIKLTNAIATRNQIEQLVLNSNVFSGAEREEWHLTGPLGPNATAVALNGATLAFRVDPTTGGAVLPALNGRKVARVPGQNDHVILAPASIAFVRVSDGPAADLCASVEM